MKYLFSLLITASLISCATSPNLTESIAMDMETGYCNAFYITNAEKQQTLIDEGVHWERLDLSWKDLQPRADHWNLGHYDDRVNAVEASGIKLLAVLGFDTPWLHGTEERLRYITPEQMDQWLLYVEETVLHYQDRVDAWEIWNEPNFWVFWRSNPQDYYLLLDRTAQLISELDPGKPIMNGGVWRVPNRFISRMFRSGAMDQVDYLAFHPYTISPETGLRLSRKAIRIAERYDFQGGYAITEIGFPTGGWYLTRRDMDYFAEDVFKTLCLQSLEGMDILTWYNYEGNREFEPRNSEQQFYLRYDEPGYPRKAGWAMEWYNRFVYGRIFQPEQIEWTEGNPSSLTTLSFLDEDSQVLVIWNNGRSSKGFTITNLPNGSQLWDLRQPDPIPLADSTLEISRREILIVEIPSRDPLRLSQE